MRRRRMAMKLAILCTAIALSLFGCGTESTFTGRTADDATIVVGSQDFYENEIIAEAYAQALEAEGYQVERSFRIGQREIYMPEIETGSIDVFPEYTGNLLKYLDEDATATESREVYDALVDAIPLGLRILDQADATDTDSYVVTRELAEKYGLSSIGDLAGLDGIVLAGNSELESRAYGPTGLRDVYGVEIERFAPIEDSGGPLTVKALRDGDVTVADLYSSTPELAAGDLVMLEDPEGMFLASHVVPIVSDNVDANAAEIINRVNAALTSEALIKMNDESVNGKRSAADIAREFLTSAGILP